MKDTFWYPIEGILARLLIVTSVLPYLAFSMGSNTNLPLSSVIAAGLVLRAALVGVGPRRMRNVGRGRTRELQNEKLLKLAGVIVFLPMLANFVRMFFDPEPWLPSGMITWLIASVPLAGMAAAVLILRRRILPWLTGTLLLSSVIALIQKYFFLDQGVVPWLWVYDSPGYASVRDLAPSIAQYVRRPFGLFPEPSFMAGSLSMLAFAILLTLHAFDQRPRLIHYLAIGSAAVVISISGSGVAVVAVALIVVAVVMPLLNRQALVGVVLIPVALLTAVIQGLNVLTNRNMANNYSWDDRMASIAGSAQLLLSNTGYFLWGIGRGNSTFFFHDGKVPLDDFVHYNPLPDIYSVLGRMILENGVLFGLPLVVLMAWFILRAGGKLRPMLGIYALAVWVVGAGLAISYDTAFWIFGLPGVAVGLQLLGPELAEESKQESENMVALKA